MVMQDSNVIVVILDTITCAIFYERQNLFDTYIEYYEWSLHASGNFIYRNVLLQS